MGVPRTWPDLAVLDLLVSISRCGSLGAGARAVGMAQPNASRAVARFERAAGVPLLQRSPRGSTITPEGAVVVDWARAVVEAADHLLRGLAALREAPAGGLTVAASQTVAEYLVPAWLAALARRDPGLEVSLAVHNSHDVLTGVRAGRYRVGFIESPEVPVDLHHLVVGQDDLVVVVHPDHAWATAREPLTPADLAAARLTVREPGSGTRDTLEAALAGLPVAAPALELGSNAAIRGSVLAGAAPAVLSRYAVVSALQSGALVEVPVAGLVLTRWLRAVWSGPRRLDHAAGDLVAIAGAGLGAAR